MITFQLMGEMPSKKNAWRRGQDGQVYIPTGMKIDIDDFLWQLKSIKGRERLTTIQGPIKVSADFTFRRDADLDNITTTLLDLLQASQFIRNDKNVQSLVATKRRHKTSAFVIVTIEEVELGQ